MVNFWGAACGYVVEFWHSPLDYLEVTEEALFWKLCDLNLELGVDNSDRSFVQKVEVVKFLAWRYNCWIVDKNNAVQSGKHFSNENEVCEVLVNDIIKKEEKLLVVTAQKSEHKFRL